MAALSEPVGDPAGRLLLRVVRGDATPEEVAALVAVIASMGGGEPATPKPRSTWSHPARGVRSVHRHGPGAWRASGLPR
jgi:sarcosine oxidase gamma subunit